MSVAILYKFVDTDIDLLGPILGGAIISGATCLYALGFCREAICMSSLFRSLFRSSLSRAFLAGFLLGTYVLISATGGGELLGVKGGVDPLRGGALASAIVFLSGGLLMGIGTTLAGGCPISLGVHGVPSLSLRAWVASGTFCLVGILVSSIMRGGCLLVEQQVVYVPDLWSHVARSAFLCLCISTAGAIAIAKSARYRHKLSGGVLIGALFGAGLSISGLCRRSTILGFLTLPLAPSLRWNLALPLAMGTAMLLNAGLFAWLHIQVPAGAEPSIKRTIVGAICLGAGWGTAGVCPGPAIVNAFFAPQAAGYLASMAVGQRLAETCWSGDVNSHNKRA